MPIPDQNNQLAQLLQMVMRGKQMQAMPPNPGGSALGNPGMSLPSTPGMTQLSPTAGLSAPQQAAPPTLGIGRGMPMQMPPLQSANPDPQGVQDKPPADPFLAGQ